MTSVLVDKSFICCLYVRGVLYVRDCCPLMILLPNDATAVLEYVLNGKGLKRTNRKLTPCEKE